MKRKLIMGASKSIKTLAEENQEFQEFIQNIEKQTSGIRDRLLKVVADGAQTFYKANKYDHSIVAENVFSDYQTTSTWSLDNVTKIVKQITSALTGAKPVSGDSIVEPDEKTRKELEQRQPAILAVQDNVVQTALALIGGIMQSFEQVNAVKTTESTRSISLGNGLHMFFAANVQVKSDKRFFESSFIQQYSLAYSLYFSVDEALALDAQRMIKNLTAQQLNNDELIAVNEEVFVENTKIAIKNRDKKEKDAALAWRTEVDNELKESNDRFAKEKEALKPKADIEKTVLAAREIHGEKAAIEYLKDTYNDEHLEYALEYHNSKALKLRLEK